MRENKVLGMIFSNMHDSMLGELTDRRTTGSVPFGGRYRLIDFVLSDMVQADITDIGIITKSNYQSLMDHVGAGRAWDLSRKRGGLALLPPFASKGSGHYRGRLEALHGVLGYIKHNNAKYVLIADCDMIARIDFRDMINTHIKSGAQVTMAYKNVEVRPEVARDATTLIVNPETMDVTDMLVNPDPKGTQNLYLNVLLMEKTLLERIVSEGASHDEFSLIRHVLQPAVGKLDIKGYEFTAFARKIAGMQSYFQANMELLRPEVREALFPTERPVFTKVRDDVPVKYGLSSKVSNSLIADGCVINGTVENSIIFRGAKIGKGAVIKNSIIMQDSYIGDNAHLEYLIADKDVLVSDSRTLIGYQTYPIYIAKGKRV